MFFLKWCCHPYIFLIAIECYSVSCFCMINTKKVEFIVSSIKSTQTIFVPHCQMNRRQDRYKIKNRKREINGNKEIWIIQLTLGKLWWAQRQHGCQPIQGLCIGDPKNDYNLNIPRYIDSQEAEDIQDIEAHLLGGIPKRDIEAMEKYLDLKRNWINTKW